MCDACCSVGAVFLELANEFVGWRLDGDVAVVLAGFFDEAPWYDGLLVGAVV